MGLALAIYSEKFATELADLNVTDDKLEDYFSGATNILALFGINTKVDDHLKLSGRICDLPAFQVIHLLNFVRRWKV